MDECATAPAPPNAFRAAEKRFRRCGTADPSAVSTLADAIDFARPETNTPANLALLETVAVDADAPAWLRDARVYALRGVDGFRFICSPFSAAAQLEWARTALRSWAEPPDGVTNLDPPGAGAPARAREEALWDAHRRGGSSSSGGVAAAKSQLSKLAWVTLGYHYQWTERRYEPTKRSRFPPQLARLADELASAAGWRLRAEAAIVNYYHAGSTMGGHRDDAEPFQGAPPPLSHTG